jgi:hypothetical protein
MANFLNTRIRLKYDLYQNWYDKNPTLLEGEVAIAVPGDKLGTVDTAAACLMKVGNGTSAFRDLPWLAAPAADVHEWAKKNETDFKAWLVSENGPHLANKSELAALKTELEKDIQDVSDALDAYKSKLGFAEPGEGKTVSGVIAETYATKDEVNALDTKVGYTGAETLVKFIEDTYATKTSVATDIATEKSRAESAESALETAIGNEKTRAEAAEKVLTDAIAALNGEGEGSVDARIEAAIAAEAQARDAAILVETNARAAEITRVEGLVTAEASRAAGVEAGLRTDVDAIKGDYLKAADKTELQGNIDTLTDVVEALRDGVDAKKVDGVLDLIKYVEDHGTEVTGMKQDITDNATAIASEVTRATEAEAAEAKARADADTALGERIDDANTALDNYKKDIGFTKTDKTLVDTIAATYATKTDLDGAVEDINELIDGINSDASGLKGRVEANETKLAGLTTATVVGDIAAAEGRAATDAQTKATKAKDDAIAAAATDATTKANQALADAKAYTDTEIDKVESTITDLQNFNETVITGAETGGVLTLSLNGTALDIVICCGSATENI